MVERTIVEKSDRVLVERVEPAIYRLEMTSPSTQNRLDEGLFRDVIAGFDVAARQSDLKVLVIAGGRDVFCGGASLDVLQKLARREASEKSFFALPDRFFSFPMPIVGAVGGHAVGGGLMLALYCDLLVGAEDSRYGLNFTDLGFTPGMGATGLLASAIGPHLANEMILTGKLYKGRELREMSLFNRVVPADQVETTCLDLARRIAEKPAHVLALLKETMSLPRRIALPEALQREEMMHRLCFSVPETANLIERNYRQ